MIASEVETDAPGPDALSQPSPVHRPACQRRWRLLSTVERERGTSQKWQTCVQPHEASSDAAPLRLGSCPGAL